MKCGVSSALKRLHDGCGMRLIITQGEYWPIWRAPGKMRSLKLRALLVPLGITRYYTDKAGVYQRHLPLT
jgi:hypothetical protein